ncbi:hypothetical protein [Thermodesulfatator autotrophicus]|uniref:hypothetical protein n=1 Tax=Thermodesulfatator autotrophicus TaxID=1795632 RepID=UPI0012FB367C|nr:hypothetical protein [Thermodesulfatator autotrophicus]
MFELYNLEKIKKEIKNIQEFLEDWEDLYLLLEAEEERAEEETYTLDEIELLLEGEA